MKVIMEGDPKEIAALVVAIQERHIENALYDYEHDVKITIGERTSGGGGGAG